MIYLRNDILKESRRLRCAKINHSRAILARIWIALTPRGFGGGSVKINRTILTSRWRWKEFIASLWTIRINICSCAFAYRSHYFFTRRCTNRKEPCL